MPRTENVSHFKWHVSGTLCDTPIEKKYLSLNQFLDEWGGDKTCMKLNRQKVNRLRINSYCPEWNLEITQIKEQRKSATVYYDE